MWAWCEKHQKLVSRAVQAIWLLAAIALFCIVISGPWGTAWPEHVQVIVLVLYAAASLVRLLAQRLGLAKANGRGMGVHLAASFAILLVLLILISLPPH